MQYRDGINRKNVEILISESRRSYVTKRMREVMNGEQFIELK